VRSAAALDRVGACGEVLRPVLGATPGLQATLCTRCVSLWRTVKRRYFDWIERGVFADLFKALGAEPDREWRSLDPTIVRLTPVIPHKRNRRVQLTIPHRRPPDNRHICLTNRALESGLSRPGRGRIGSEC